MGFPEEGGMSFQLPGTRSFLTCVSRCDGCRWRFFRTVLGSESCPVRQVTATASRLLLSHVQLYFAPYAVIVCMPLCNGVARASSAMFWQLRRFARTWVKPPECNGKRF